MSRIYLFILFLPFFLCCSAQNVLAAEIGSWKTTSDMTSVSYNASSILLNNGRVLITGYGFNADDQGFSNEGTQLYDPVLNLWHKETPFVNPAIDSKSIKLPNGNVLVMGIGYVNNYYQSAQRYDYLHDTWNPVAQPIYPAKRQFSATLLPNNKVLLAGGFDNETLASYATSEIYNSDNNTWSKTNSMNTPRNLHTDTLLQNGKVLVTGGATDYSDSESLASVETYDYNTGAWIYTSPMLVARILHTATLLPDGRVLVTGGERLVNDHFEAYSSAEIYDPETESWQAASNMHTPRALHSAVLLPNGKVLVSGGNSGDDNINILNTAEIYDPTTNVWSVVSPMHYARQLHTSTILSDGRVLIAGGYNNGLNELNGEIFSLGDVLGEGVGPFLGLPFDYVGKGKTFDEVAFNPVSWFDHKYPLQNVACCLDLVTKYNYDGSDAIDNYRSHSGYDYGSKDGVTLGMPVLAAAAGSASFVPAAESGGGGNEIKIDHGNGYQTWYEHLSDEDLIVNTQGNIVQVAKGQQIGKVGLTGNTDGPHIHMSVFKDENNNGTFDDDYPFGLVDPLGWEGKDFQGNTIIDPWTQYSVEGRHGAESNYLFLNSPASAKDGVTSDEKKLALNKNVQLQVPQNVYPTFFTISSQNSAYEKQDEYESVMPSLLIEATDSVGNAITQFLKPMQLIFDYAGSDLLNIQETSLKAFYFNRETRRWEAIPSVVDQAHKKVTATTTHFSHFALMGKVKDKIAPQTIVKIQGTKGKDNWYRSDVKVTLEGKDSPGSVGLQYTLYSLDNSDWKVYTAPILFTKEGDHTVYYMTIDKADNKERRTNFTIHIDKTTPEADISYDLSTFDTALTGKDASGTATVTTTSNSLTQTKSVIADKAGNKISLILEQIKVGKQVALTLKSMQYNDNTPIQIDKNIYFTLIGVEKNTIKQVDQYYSLKDDKKVFTKYTSGTGVTKIYTKSVGTQYKEETKTGIDLLHLYTEAGKLKFTY